MAGIIDPRNLNEYRGGTNIYGGILLNQINKAIEISVSSSKSDDYTDWFQFEVAVRGVDALISPYYSKEYVEAVDAIKEKLKDPQIKFFKENYFYHVMFWLKHILYRLAEIPDIQVMPLSNTITVMGNPDLAKKEMRVM